VFKLRGDRDLTRKICGDSAQSPPSHAKAAHFF